ncbi:uncharacterized protein LY89DRAFT_779394 [Mollisia scopiformis]|uniref:Uncharacterized protein n=1 Tax=Mollisia scopiformis TaxID=149040 RepID=A0A194XLL6_MOLSC|nr:uncharacterized protein LY89DRAFT_779394 [Mollisia scopiformis]KUJ20662.1 hypothetical protein LY89DRAFT_779394 [Mollisia scopiformis]
MPAPGQFLPRKSSAHRIACIALYRALLKQCPHIPLPDDVPLRGNTNPITHFIQKAFRKNVYHTSPKLVVTALETGYAACSLLHHAATSSPESPNPSLLQVHDLLRAQSNSYVASKLACPPKPPPGRPASKAYPGAPKAVDIRPLPKEKLTGRRHVPKLVAVHGIFPFLRFRKPQSAYLSRVLTQKVKRKLRRFERLAEMEGAKEMGEWEDVWEDTVSSVGHLKNESRRDSEWEDGEKGVEKGDYKPFKLDSQSWGEAPHYARLATWSALAKEGARARRLGSKMLEIIDQEQKLWEEERRERRHLKNLERKRRKLESLAQEGKSKNSSF